MVKPKNNTTDELYRQLAMAMRFFNTELFDGLLPDALITLQRKRSAKAFFAPERFEKENQLCDEIALNPEAFMGRTEAEILSSLVHEMVHQWQFHLGNYPKRGYHNRQWADKMKEIGLQPTADGTPEGKETGSRCTHIIIEGGVFQEAYYKLKERMTFNLDLVDKWLTETAPRGRSANKSHYCCPNCGAMAYAKPHSSLVCGPCTETAIHDLPWQPEIGDFNAALVYMEETNKTGG